ncbi:hypothetical protein [Salipiger mucosus]|uniref:Excinuclease ABC subunit B n=1 Tax=Salipiger mucosus DSM 16094 TaxID=1123237 RepID=S9S0A0_9RHOB|nr:hypothetical protein [Salipiger mucosus]EPX79644.1 excinuclease ABC subunit B [Salipiger mucosus DSM 16094]
MRKRFLVLLPLIALTACGTPLERCLREAAAPYRDALEERERIARDLGRGFTYETGFERVVTRRWCRTQKGTLYYCRETSMEPVTRRVPIDADALRARDAQLARDLPALRRAAAEDQGQCRAAFPVEEELPE